MTESKSGVSLGVVVVCLITLGAVLWYSINQLSADIPAAAIATSTPGASLIEAAARGDVGIVEALIKAGASVDKAREPAGPQAGMTALMAAAAAGKADCVRLLIKASAQPNTRSPDGKTALMFAAGWGNAATVRALLESNARVNERSDDRMSALHFAAARGEMDAVKSLLDAGADA